MNVFDKISNTIVDTSKYVSKKSKDFTKTASLNSKLSSAQSELNRIYSEIGKSCYVSKNNISSIDFSALFAATEQAEIDIKTISDEIATLKGDIPCTACNRMIDKNSGFCRYCGAPNGESKIVNCPNCSAVLEADVAFCGSCGTKIK